MVSNVGALRRAAVSYAIAWGGPASLSGRAIFEIIGKLADRRDPAATMHFLGIEIDHAGTRAVVLDLEAAAIRCEAWLPHTWIAGLPGGYREQDPAQWIGAVDGAVRKCLAELGKETARVAGIGVAGPQRGMVVLDTANRIVRPTKLAGDTSVKRQADEIARAFGTLSGSAAAECLWLKQHEPYHFRRAASLLTVQDFLAYWLTGERATEAGSASCTGLLDIRRREWSRELLDFVDSGLPSLLPPLAACRQPRGLLRPALAREWGLSERVQIGAGGAAPMLEALAAGCVGHGSVAVDLRAAGTIIGVADAPVIDPRGEIAGLCSATGNWLAVATPADAAVSPQAVQRHYGWSANEFEEMAASVAPGADGLLLVSDGAGMLLGIRPDNFTPAHIARAAAESVALGFGYGMSRLRELGIEPPEVRLIGADGASSRTRQMLADALGATVVPVSSRHGAAVGAAMQAAVGFFQESGESLDFAELTTYFVTGDAAASNHPDPAAHAVYQEMLARQQRLVEALRPAEFR